MEEEGRREGRGRRGDGKGGLEGDGEGGKWKRKERD